MLIAANLLRRSIADTNGAHYLSPGSHGSWARRGKE